MKKLILFSLFAVSLSYAGVGYQLGGVIDDDTVDTTKEAPEISARSTYMKACAWTFMAGYLLRFYPYSEVIKTCTRLIGSLWHFGLKQGLERDLYGFEVVGGGDYRHINSSSVRGPLYLFGGYYVASKAIRSLKKAYDVYTQ